jgi:serine/threonine-protein kinase ATR
MSNLIRKLDDSDISTIFKVCRNLKDNNIPAFLLAHLILYNVLIDQSDFIENLVTEILSVLNDVSDSPSRPDEDLLIEVTSNDREKREICTQVYCLFCDLIKTVFSLLDHLANWIRHAGQIVNSLKMSSLKSKKTASPQVAEYEMAISKVGSVLDHIPQKTRATAAFRCKAFARALMHYELYFRSNGSLVKSMQDRQVQRDFGQLQKIYSYLDEADGLEGITMMFTKPTMDQKILEHESNGVCVYF